MRWENLNQKHRLKMVVSTGNIEMYYLINPDNFPVESLPPLIKNAVLEMQDNTKFPLPLIVSSALGAISLACQNSIDVRLPIGSITPCALFMMLIADSGEAKSPADQSYTKPIRDFEENEARKSEHALPQQKAHRSIWAIEQKEIEAAIKKNKKKFYPLISPNKSIYSTWNSNISNKNCWIIYQKNHNNNEIIN